MSHAGIEKFRPDRKSITPCMYDHDIICPNTRICAAMHGSEKICPTLQEAEKMNYSKGTK